MGAKSYSGDESLNGTSPQTQTTTHTRPSTTLVVPNYNHARYLPESLCSIAAQTQAPDRVLIIDDASTDDSVAIISRFLADHPTWELIRHEINRGVVYGQNEAIASVTTDWIGFLGADDVLHASYLEKALSGAASCPDAGLVCACCEIIGPSPGRMLRPMMLPALESKVLSPSDVRAILLAGDNYFPGTVSLFRCGAINALGGFDESLGSFADSLLARQLALNFGFYFVAEILGYWRIHGQNYSMGTATDPAALSERITEIRHVIAGSDLFPPGFDELFERRTRFGAARTVISTGMPIAAKAKRATELLCAGDYERRLLQFLLGLGRMASIATLAWLSLRTRPMSLFRLLGQWKVRRRIVRATRAYRVT